MNPPSKGTVSVSFIFLKNSKFPEDSPKKIIFPKSYAFLMKKANEIYGNKMEIRSIYDEDGKKISNKSIDKITPGSVLYVSPFDSKNVHDYNYNDIYNNGNYNYNDNSKDIKNPKNKEGIISTESYEQLFGTKIGDKISDDKLPNNKIKRIGFTQTNESEKENNSKERKRFLPHPERQKKQQQQKKEMIEKSQKFNQIKARRAKNQDDQMTTGSIKSNQTMVNTAKRIPIPGSDKNVSKDDTTVSPTKRKHNFFDNDSQSLETKGKQNYDENNINDDENQYEYEIDNDYDNNNDNVYNGNENNNYYNDENSNNNDFYDNQYNNENFDENTYNNEYNDANTYESSISHNNEDDYRKKKPKKTQKNTRKRSNKDSSSVNNNNAQTNAMKNNDNFVSQSENENYDGNSNGNQNQNYYENSDANDEDANESNEAESLKNLIADTICDKEALSKNIPKALEDLPLYSDALKLLPDIEVEQKHNWFSHVNNLINNNGIFPQVKEDFYGIDEMTLKAREILANHRFYSNEGGVTHRLNIGIIGPSGSGKSTFMRILSEEALIELASTDEWKKTFLFFVDINVLISDTQEYSNFYHSIVEKTMNCIESQKPELISLIPMIKKTFNNVVIYDRPPKFPRSFMIDPKTQKIANDLQNLVNAISNLWNNEEALVEWITHIMYLPILISKALGFQKSIYIVDHFDVGDIIFDPSPTKFSESPSCAYLIDILKFILSQTNFIISCSDQDVFLALLEPNMGEERQAQKVFDFISMLDMIQDVKYSDKQILVDVENERTPISMTKELFGGVPSYIEYWVKVNQIFDKIDNFDEEEEEEDEYDEEILKDQLISVSAKILKLLYADGNKFEIKDVPRRK